MLRFPFCTSRSFEVCPKRRRSGSSECWPVLVPEYAFESACCLCCVTLWQACFAVFWARGLDRWGLYSPWHRSLRRGSGSTLFTWPLHTDEHNSNFPDKSQLVIWPLCPSCLDTGGWPALDTDTVFFSCKHPNDFLTLQEKQRFEITFHCHIKVNGY